MRKVFIPSLPTRWDAATHSRVPSLDLNPAAKYGDLENMTDGDHHDIQADIERIRIATAEVRHDDLLLCVGDVILCAAAIAFISDQNGEVNVLRWDKVKRGYNIEEVTL